MENDSYSSNVSPSECLKRRLNSTQEISKVLDNSSILQNYQSKVKELQDIQEKYISVSTQLKIANESMRMKDAEYAFQISQLNEEIENMKKIETSLRIQISKSEVEISKKTHTYDVQVSLMIESLQKEVDQQNEQLNKLQNIINEKNDQILKEKERVKAIAQRFRLLHDKYDEEKSKHQNQQSDMVKKQNERLKIIKEDQNKQKSILDHIESERDSLYDLLDIEPEDINGKWSNLFNKCSQLNAQNKNYSNIQKSNEKLKKRLSVALEESRKAPNKTHEGEHEYDELVDSLRLSLHQAESEANHLKSQLSKMELRNKFVALIEKKNASFSKQLNELHDFVFEKNNSSNIRALFLAVIFSKRLLRVFRGPSVSDPNALHVFKGRDSASMELKLRNLRDKYVQLTQDLLLEKQNWIDKENQRKELKQQLKNTNKNLEKSSNGNENSARQILLLKNRILELQQELSTLSATNGNGQLHQNEISQKIEFATPCPCSNQDESCSCCTTDDIRLLRVSLSDKDKELELLKSLLKEKTKEILALERLVSRQKHSEKMQKSNFTCMSVENQILNDAVQSTRIHEPETVTLFSGKNYGLSCHINPAFLGQ